MNNNSKFKEITKKIEIVGMFADDNDWFEVDFIVNLDKYFKRTKKLSDKQLKALNNIIKNCRVNEWFNKEYPNGFDFEFNFESSKN